MSVVCARPLLALPCSPVIPVCLLAFLLLLQGLLWALGHALTTLKSHREDFRAMQRRGMERDASWDLAAQQYEQVFEWALVSGRSGRGGAVGTASSHIGSYVRIHR